MGGILNKTCGQQNTIKPAITYK